MNTHFGWIPRQVLIVKIIFAYALLIPLAALAQTPGKALSGTVRSVSGSPIPNAQVTTKNLANAETSAHISNQEGLFTFTNLSPGIYEITASAPGFAVTRMQISILEGQNQTVNITLQAETGGGEKGQTPTSGVSGVVSSKSVTDLPLNGRSASDLAALEPGVASARTQSSGQAQRGFGNQMTISGGRPRQNDSRLDGISVNDYSNGPPASALGVNLGADAV